MDKGPSILTTAPEPPVGMPGSASPYRMPGKPPEPPPDMRPVRLRPSESVPPAKAPPVPTVAVGDRAGEHLAMERGRYRAWLHVVVAFLLEIMLLGVLPALAFHAVLGTTGDSLGLVVGLVVAWLVFRDRWRCTEAYASRYCSGLANLSVLYVPIVALIYANARGIAKLR